MANKRELYEAHLIDLNDIFKINIILRSDNQHCKEVAEKDHMIGQDCKSMNISLTIDIKSILMVVQ